METNFGELFAAVLSSRKFTKLFDGVDFKLPDGKNTKIKIESYARRSNLEGFRFSKFSFVTKAISDLGVIGYGFGEGENELLTFQKSIAEATERVVYSSVKPFHGLNSSSGWAAHLSQTKANQSALNELIERDAILAHWLTKTPFHEIDPETFPGWLKAWTKAELSKSENFNRLRLLISHVGHVPVIQSLILNDEGFAFASHGMSRSIDNAVYRALGETCRIATAAKNEPNGNDLDKESVAATPWDHALAYTGKVLPDWVFGKMLSYCQARDSIKRADHNPAMSKLAAEFKTYRCGDLFISHCESNKLQKLFFGRGDFALKKGLINLDRLQEVNSAFVLNPLPHCVP